MKVMVLVAVALFVLSLAIPAEAMGEHYLGNPGVQCTSKGQMWLAFGNSSCAVLNPSELKVFANTSNERFEVDGDFFFEFEYRTGFFEQRKRDWKRFDERPIYISGVNMWPSLFLSESVFKERKNYTIEMEYVPTGNVISRLEMKCPREEFSCGRVRTNIDKCFNKDGVFYAYLKISGLDQPSSSLNLGIEDVRFNMVGEKFQKSLTGDVPKMELLGDNKYILKYLTEDVVEELEVKVPACKKTEVEVYSGFIPNPYYKAKADCAEAVECMTPTDCDDGDVCTRDRCVSNSCKHDTMCEPEEANEPEAKDISDVVVPEEKTGSEEPNPPAEPEELRGDGITGHVSAGNEGFINNLIGGLLNLFGL